MNQEFTFGWLEEEIRSIGTPRFHLVDGPADAKLLDAMLQSQFCIPSSYKEFVARFGNAKLYRYSRTGYKIGVFASPREAHLESGETLYHLGFHQAASVYVKQTAGSADTLPIFEFDNGEEEEIAPSFDVWLAESCSAARQEYSKAQWAKISRGPLPFTLDEAAIVRARSRMHWRVVGIAPNGNHLIEVANNSEAIVPCLTLGVRSRDGRLNGAVRLKTLNIEPGNITTLAVDCYKDLVPPKEIEVFMLPDPEPEDREYYCELSPGPTTRN